MSGPDLSVRPGAALTDRDLPTVAVVILNLNGRHHLAPCFASLRASDYPDDRFRIVLVDNASTDGSREEMRSKHAWVELIENARNVGFAAGCNQGAREAEGAEVLVFLNNDMRVEPPFLRELVAPVVRGECAASTAKMYSWDGKVLNSAGGGMNFHGIGIQRGYLEDPHPRYDEPQKTLFACGGAMAMRADRFAAIGGFDEDYFAYYEDVDLGWRTWVLGDEVHYAPQAVCYHHHSSTSGRMPREMIRLLQVRNPLYSCFKNYGERALATVLPAALALSERRAFLHSGLDPHDADFRIEEARGVAAGAPGGPGGAVRRMLKRAREAAGESAPVRRTAAADWIGLNDLLGNYARWAAKREDVQARRARADEEIFDLFRGPLWCIEADPSYRALHDGLVRLLGIDRLFAGRASDDPLPRG